MRPVCARIVAHRLGNVSHLVHSREAHALKFGKSYESEYQQTIDCVDRMSHLVSEKSLCVQRLPSKDAARQVVSIGGISSNAAAIQNSAAEGTLRLISSVYSIDCAFFAISGTTRR